MKMRIAAAATALLCMVPAGLRGQDSLRLNELRTPTSPAFVILGVEPTSIERPTTPRAFALGLLSAPGGAGGVIPENYAAEFAPYWMRSHPDLTFQEYVRPNPLQSLLQTFSVSLATTVLATGADSTTGVGIGFRATPLMGQPPRQLRLLSDSLRLVQRALLNLSDELEVATTRADSQRITRLYDARSAQSRTLSAAIRALPEDERVGLFLQVAGALAGYYPQNDFSAGRVGRAGAWGTVTYRAEVPRVDVIGLARWLRDEAEVEQNAVDLGFRGVFRFNRLSASAEWVNRAAAEPADGADADAGGFSDSRRVVGQLEYRASDDLFVTFSFGQDFANVGDDREPLVAILGGQLHFGAKPVVPLP
jgi:hypothetical protein